MSDWSSFQKDKRTADAWRQFLKESQELDERAGFLAGLEHGARAAAGLGQRPDDKAPGIAKLARTSDATKLKKKIDEAVSAILRSTTLEQFEERYVELATILRAASSVRLSEATDEEIKAQQASRNLSDRLRNMVDNYESDEPLDREDAQAVVDSAQQAKTNEPKVNKVLARVLKTFGIDPEELEDVQGAEAAVKKMSSEAPAEIAAEQPGLKGDPEEWIEQSKKELAAAKKAWHAASQIVGRATEEADITAGKTARLKSAMQLSDFGLPEEQVRQIRMKWLELMASKAGQYTTWGGQPEPEPTEEPEEPELELADDDEKAPPEPRAIGGWTDAPQDYGDQPDTSFYDDFRIDDYGPKPEPGMEDYDTPTFAGATDKTAARRAAARPPTITPTADQEYEKMSPEELKKAQERTARMVDKGRKRPATKKKKVAESKRLTESEIKRFKLLAGIKK